jgi:hypothetical protein
MDGKASSAVVVAALFLYTQLFRTIEEALQMFAVKRCPPGLNASQYRFEPSPNFYQKSGWMSPICRDPSR